MLQLTRRTEYGLIALVHMVDREREPVSVRELGERYKLPLRLLAEVLKDLCRCELVESHRGASGGYYLARRPEEITLGDVVGALEGVPHLIRCQVPALLRDSTNCDVQPTCPIRSPIQHVHERLLDLLQRTTLRSLAEAPSRSLAETAERSAALSATTSS